MQSTQALSFSTNKAAYVLFEPQSSFDAADSRIGFLFQVFSLNPSHYQGEEATSIEFLLHKQSPTRTGPLAITAMSAQSEPHHDYAINLPLSSFEQLQALHDYNESLIKAGAQADLYLSTREPALCFSELSSNASLDAAESTDTQWSFWKKRDDEITRALCEDQIDKKARWERLYEQWSTAQGAAGMIPAASRSQSYNNLYLDPCLENTNTTALRDHNKQLLAMNTLLYLQDQESQFRQDSSFGDDTGDHGRVGLQQGHLERLTSINPESQLPIDQNLLHCDDDSTVPYVGGPVEQSITLRDEELEDQSATIKINVPSISFLPPSSNGYDHPPIHFPSLSYVVEGITNNLDHKYQDSTPERDTSQSQNITSDTPFDNLVFSASTDDDQATDPSESSLIHAKPPKDIKKGTEPKKSFVPTRRWSRTYLNQLMRKHRPRNLPEGMNVTDSIKVQDIPLELLTHEYCEVKAEKEGETVYIGAGTRVDIPPDDDDDDVILEISDEGIVESVEARPVEKRTPFRLMIMDQHGNVKVDMSWHANVLIDEPVNQTPLSKAGNQSLPGEPGTDGP